MPETYFPASGSFGEYSIQPDTGPPAALTDPERNHFGTARVHRGAGPVHNCDGLVSVAQRAAHP